MVAFGTNSDHAVVFEIASKYKYCIQMFKLDLEKAEEPEIKLPTSAGSSKKQESSRKISTSASLTMPKPFCGPQQSLENS